MNDHEDSCSDAIPNVQGAAFVGVAGGCPCEKSRRGYHSRDVGRGICSLPKKSRYVVVGASANLSDSRSSWDISSTREAYRSNVSSDGDCNGKPTIEYA